MLQRKQLSATLLLQESHTLNEELNTIEQFNYTLESEMQASPKFLFAK